MRRSVIALSLTLLAGCGSGSPSPGGGTATPTPAPTPTTAATGDWKLAWADEFDGPAGTLPDSSKWTFETGGNFPNNELEYYTARPSNASLSGNGALVISALAEHYQGPDGVVRAYTSARLNTSHLFEPTYGKFESRMRIPRGQGLWPAFWLLGANISQVGWPACGEIDIMENIGLQPATIWGSMHGPGFSGASAKNASFNVSGAYADDFHVFTVEWEKNAIRWYVDGTLYESRSTADLNSSQTWVFDHPFFLILNVAVGGDWPGNPDATSTFPQEMTVDYVHAYQR
jgi:beta-glucanase (GH16 family)